MKSSPLPIPENDAERKIIADIENSGWHLAGIPMDDQGPAYLFSIGLYRTFKHPEIMIFGLDMSVAVTLLTTLARQIKSGKSFTDSDVVTGVAEGFPLTFRSVPRSRYEAYLGYALWFYQTPEFPVLQCVWPDQFSRFPEDAQCDAGCREVQRLTLLT